MHISTEFNQDIFKKITDLWVLTGIANPARCDSFEIIANTLKMGGKMITLMDQDRLVGTVWLTNDGRRMHTHHMTIHPEYQGKGLSKLLLEPALEFARELGLQPKLEVHESNPVARYLYKKYGFDELPDYIVMVKRS
ncbi:MAG: GNAT family N-acetyltransferase [Candidatus Zophobacter franzmannii]|jgi:GNAT superfamily N-acetyltransferase|nr:GNAT family N-acetyltransferase [Candidatus Zophobacter franzmannii]